MGNVAIVPINHPAVRFDSLLRADKPHQSWKETTSRASQHKRRRAPLTHVDKYAGR